MMNKRMSETMRIAPSNRSINAQLLLLTRMAGFLFLFAAVADSKDTGIQLADNPPMQLIMRSPPEPTKPGDEFEIREGFRLLSTLEAFRTATKLDGQKIRLKPGTYRVQTPDTPQEGQEHLFAVNGSNNHFDLRGVVIETPVSAQSLLTSKSHVADSWHINGSENVFEGGYFRNIIDKPYPDYQVTESEFEVRGDGNCFLDCIFVIKGSIPFGYTDYYGKGGPNYGRLNKHSFMGISHANDTRLERCQVYLQSFGHCVHFHYVDGVQIKDCFFTGALRPTNDIYRETSGRAKEYDFHKMYRKKEPIPRDQMIPLVEDGIRSYEEVKNITVVNTTVERMRGCFQLVCVGDVTLDNVIAREAGDFCFDVSSGSLGKVTMKNCSADLAYNPIFNLTRGAVPKNDFFEVTLVNADETIEPTSRTSWGNICGKDCAFVLRNGTTRPQSEESNYLICGKEKPLVNSTITNYTNAILVLTKRVSNCKIKSHGPVEDQGTNNVITSIESEG